MNVMRCTAALVLAILTAMLADFAAAQTTVVGGARIRIRLPGQEPIVGRLISVSGDSLLLSPAYTDEFRTYPLGAIQSVQSSRGASRSLAWRGMKLGTLAGAIAFGLYYREDDAALGWTLFGAFVGQGVAR
jgi:hypothetical protein